jgi:hypothetical protein
VNLAALLGHNPDTPPNPAQSAWEGEGERDG